MLPMMRIARRDRGLQHDSSRVSALNFNTCARLTKSAAQMRGPQFYRDRCQFGAPVAEDEADAKRALSKNNPDTIVPGKRLSVQCLMDPRSAEAR
jgi:hypothetical protein